MKGRWYFLIIVGFLYLVISFLAPKIGLNAFYNSLSLLKKIIPALLFVLLIMLLVNLFVTNKRVKEYLGSASGYKKWLISVLAGVISMGPIYAWYPLLKDFHKKGASYGFIASFLYARSVKPFLIPVMVFYFGVVYTIILSVLLLFGAVLQGLMFEKIEGFLG